MFLKARVKFFKLQDYDNHSNLEVPRSACNNRWNYLLQIKNILKKTQCPTIQSLPNKFFFANLVTLLLQTFFFRLGWALLKVLPDLVTLRYLGKLFTIDRENFWNWKILPEKTFSGDFCYASVWFLFSELIFD